MPAVELTKQEIREEPVQAIITFISEKKTEELGKIDPEKIVAVKETKNDLGTTFNVEVVNNQGRTVNVVVSKPQDEKAPLLEDIRFISFPEPSKPSEKELNEIKTDGITGVKIEWKTSDDVED